MNWLVNENHHTHTHKEQGLPLFEEQEYNKRLVNWNSPGPTEKSPQSRSLLKDSKIPTSFPAFLSTGDTAITQPEEPMSQGLGDGSATWAAGGCSRQGWGFSQRLLRVQRASVSQGHLCCPQSSDLRAGGLASHFGLNLDASIS